MARSTSRMPHNQSQSIYFSKISLGGGEGGHSQDPPSGDLLKHAPSLHANFCTITLQSQNPV